MSVEICIASACGRLGTTIVLTVSLPPANSPGTVADALGASTSARRRTCRDPALPPPSFVAAFPACASFRRLRRSTSRGTSRALDCALANDPLQRALPATTTSRPPSSRYCCVRQDEYELRHRTLPLLQEQCPEAPIPPAKTCRVVRRRARACRSSSLEPALHSATVRLTRTRNPNDGRAAREWPRQGVAT